MGRTGGEQLALEENQLGGGPRPKVELTQLRPRLVERDISGEGARSGKGEVRMVRAFFRLETVLGKHLSDILREAHQRLRIGNPQPEHPGLRRRAEDACPPHRQLHGDLTRGVPGERWKQLRDRLLAHLAEEAHGDMVGVDTRPARSRRKGPTLRNGVDDPRRQKVRQWER